MSVDSADRATALEPAVARLVEAFGLPGEAGAKLVSVAARTIEDPYAPTTVRTLRGVLDEHLADSLSALALPEVRAAEQIADLGSGGGFPVLALAAALPDRVFVAVESNQRKCSFVLEAAREAGIQNLSVLPLRAEDWAEGLGLNDLVTVRALAPLDVVCEYAAPLLKLGGALVVWRGQRDVAEERAAERAAELLGLSPAPPVAVRPFPGAIHRHLHVIRKTRETPERFPRRAGMARKQPLGGRRSRSPDESGSDRTAR